MAKGLLSFIGILLLLLFSAGAAVVGLILMATSLLTSAGNFMQGMEVFFLGSISLCVTLIGYTAVKILKNTDIIADALADTLDALDDRQRSQHPLASLLGGLGQGGFPGMGGLMKMAQINKDGSITPMGEKEFGSHEEFLKFRDELINKAMNKNGKKPVAEMDLQELEIEREAAEKAQNFELAAALRDAIAEKKKNKD